MWLFLVIFSIDLSFIEFLIIRFSCKIEMPVRINLCSCTESFVIDLGSEDMFVDMGYFIANIVVARRCHFSVFSSCSNQVVYILCKCRTDVA